MLEKSQAACNEDRVRILNSIAGRAPEELDDAPLSAHEAYARTDLQLHSLFAVAAWRQAVDKGLVQQFGLPKALSSDVWRSHLWLDLHGCERLPHQAQKG